MNSTDKYLPSTVRPKDILAFSFAFLNEADLRLVLEHLLDFIRLDVVFEGKFFDNLCQPDDAFNLHSFSSAPDMQFTSSGCVRFNWSQTIPTPRRFASSTAGLL